MSFDNTERLYLERQVTLARAVLVALSLVALLETSQEPVHRASAIFLAAYLFVAVAIALADRFAPPSLLRIPLWADFVLIAIFFFMTPSVSAFWFLFLFAAFALGNRGNARFMLFAVIGATAAVILRVALADPGLSLGIGHWIAIGLGTLVSGLSMGFLAAREREHLARQQFLEKINGLLQYDHGLAESIRSLLKELASSFHCRQACIAVRDDEIERLFVWRFAAGEAEPRPPETLSLARSETFLIDSLEVSLCWSYRPGKDTDGEGFAWDRRTGERVAVPRPPRSTHDEFDLTSFLAVTLEAGGRPSGRIILIDPIDHPFSEGDLRWLEQIARHIGPPLENVSLLRNLRARTIESERSRISRDLHDGMLQTLLSLKIQLNVLQRTIAENPQKAASDVAQLQCTVEQEGAEFRRMVTDMRPLRLQSADMLEMMSGFAERFRLEHDLAVDLIVEDRNVRLPDRMCRELFQIYREALHNVKKHAGASHVVVKLVQDEARASLVIDDNGQGFSFSGRYASDELDRLRLGPISIKERTRGVGGTLTVESNPGHGARLTIDIPLN
jgi:signal transduction histidine kinase